MGTNQKLQMVKRYRASEIALSAYKIYKNPGMELGADSTVYPAVRADLAALAFSPGGAMTKSIMVLIAVLIVGASAQLGAASEQETWIVVQSDGEERAAFVLAKEPYTEGGPAVSVYLRSKNVRAKDGLVITGFEFIGWKEATSNRVLVFALVPRDDAENTYMPDGDPENLLPTRFHDAYSTRDRARRT